MAENHRLFEEKKKKKKNHNYLMISYHIRYLCF